MIALATDRLVLRPFTAEDHDALWSIHRHPLIPELMPQIALADHAACARLLERFMTLIDDPIQGYPAITLRHEERGYPAGTVVGLLMVKPIPPSGGGEAVDLEIGWRQDPAHCGHGYVTEAAQAMKDAILARGVDELVAVTHPENTASQAVAERIGLRRVGLSDAYYDATCMLFRS